MATTHKTTKTPDTEAPEALLFGAFDPLHLGEPYREDRLTPEQRRQGLHQLRLQAREQLKNDAQALADQFQPNFADRWVAGDADEDLPDDWAESVEFSKLTDMVGKWKDKTSKYLRNLYTAGALALFGPAPLQPEDHKVLDVAHAKQAKLLDNFAKEIVSGKQKPNGSLANRASLYGSSVWGAANDLDLARAKRLGYDEGRRLHLGKDKPCRGCAGEIGKGWTPIGNLKPIGAMECHDNCHCVHEFRVTPKTALKGADKLRIPMSKLNTKQRAALPASDFGDPERRLFPIVDQDDVDSAAHLIGKAKNPEKVKARIVAIAKRKGFTLPQAWTEKAKMSGAACDGSPGRLAVATFDLGSPTEANGFVLYPNSKLFEAGDYPDKDFSMSPEELWVATEQFAKPVPVDLEHIPTVLDGKLGEVRDVRLSDDGTDLMGTVAIPKWLDELLEDGKRKVSCTWDRETKTLTGLALVNKPRVADAALMAAFAVAQPSDAAAVFAVAQSTWHGTQFLQSVHDQAARAGALCDPENSARFTTSRERSAIQSVHDLAVKGGAKCSVRSGRSATYSADTNPPKGRRMSLKEKFLALFTGKPEAAPPDEAVEAFLTDLTALAKGTEPATTDNPGGTTASKVDPAAFAATDAGKAMQAKIDRLERENRLSAIRLEAAAFADGEIRAERSLPSERDQLVADFTEAAIDDLDSPRKVTFAAADGKSVQGGRVDRLKARFAARPRTILTRDVLSGADLPEGARVVFAADDEAAKKDKKPSKERLKQLMDKSPLGKQAIKKMKENLASD